jgi:hypothetical protein
MDGKDLIYKQKFGDSPLLAQRLAGGVSRQLLPCVSAVNFAVVEAGIYYAACGPGPERSMRLMDKAGRDRVSEAFETFGATRCSIARQWRLTGPSLFTGSPSPTT